MNNVVHGNYIGVVVNSNPDPEGRGRVQIFVPHLSTTLYEGWNKEGKDISITQGSLAGIDVNVLQRLQQTLPWAECAFPLFGTGGTTYADPSTGLTKPSLPSSAPAVSTSNRNSLNTDKSAPQIEGEDTNKTLGKKSLISLNSSDPGDQNLIRYAISMGYPETEFDPKSLTNINDNGYKLDNLGNKILVTDSTSPYFNSNVYKAVQNDKSINKDDPASINAAIDRAVDQYGDFGYYKINKSQIDPVLTKAGYENVDLRYGSAAEQLQAMCAYLDNYRGGTVGQMIRNGQFSAADALLNGQWQSLPGGTMSPERRANNTGASAGSCYNPGIKDPNSCIREQKQKTAMVQSIRSGDSSAASIIAKATNTTPQMVTNTGLTSNSSSYTSKVLDSTRKLSPRDMRTPNGISSVPSAGTFVWCFFMGGDPQRPVYFAGVTESFAHARTSSIPSEITPIGRGGNNVSQRAMPTTDSNGNVVKDSYGNVVYTTQTTTTNRGRASC
jgi:hypothetical protein